jgi:hypothetical protein
MIIPMIVFGLVVGWWWRVALIAGAVIWPLMLWQAGLYDDLEYVSGGAVGLTLGAAFLGAANTGVGVAIDQAVLAVVRRIRRARSGPTDAASAPLDAAPPQAAPPELG